jgi:hypothetical protein
MLNLAAIKVGAMRYNSPWTQVCCFTWHQNWGTNYQVAILGFVTFCSVGMFSALGGLGAG